MNKTLRYILTGAAVAAGAAGVAVGVSYAVSGVFLREALAREEPKLLAGNKSRMTGVSSADPRKREALLAGERLRDAGAERVEIAARDGTALVGHWMPRADAKRVIVAMHGWRSAWYRDFGALSAFWEKNGCAVLYAEQRGQGESGGDGMGFGILERYDCADWANWAADKAPGLPVYLVGVSMGATTVLMAAGLKDELPGSVKGVVADCGFTSPDAIWKKVIEDTYRLHYPLWKKQVEQLSAPRLRCAPDAYSTVDALRETARPVLFIHGEADRFVPVDMTLENYDACASPKRLLLVPGAGHAMSYLVDPEAYEREVLAFWRDCEN